MLLDDDPDRFSLFDNPIIFCVPFDVCDRRVFGVAKAVPGHGLNALVAVLVVRSFGNALDLTSGPVWPLSKCGADLDCAGDSGVYSTCEYPSRPRSTP